MIWKIYFNKLEIVCWWYLYIFKSCLSIHQYR